MEKGRIQLYSDEIKFLLGLKQAIGRLNNRIHDKLALIAIEKLEPSYPKLYFVYSNAGAAGIDIKAFDAKGKLKLIAEVKTTIPSKSGTLRGPQKKAIRIDLERLSNESEKLERYLVVLSLSTKQAIEKQLDSAVKFPSVKILNALDHLDLADVTTEDVD